MERPQASDQQAQARRRGRRERWGNGLAGALLLAVAALAVVDGRTNPQSAFWGLRLPFVLGTIWLGCYTVVNGVPDWLLNLQDFIYGTNNQRLRKRNRERRTRRNGR